jgi:exosome complex RNA-binding protein Csl4
LIQSPEARRKIFEEWVSKLDVDQRVHEDLLSMMCFQFKQEKKNEYVVTCTIDDKKGIFGDENVSFVKNALAEALRDYIKSQDIPDTGVFSLGNKCFLTILKRTYPTESPQ